MIVKTKLIFVRHGEATGNIDRIFHGFTNSELTKNGRMQAERVAERLSKEKIDYICSSDLKRAYETACTIAKHHGLSVDIRPAFREINGGLWENNPWDDLPNLFPESYDLWINEPHALQMPEGESMVGFFERLRKETEAVMREHAGKTVCIVAHGTVVRVLNCYCVGKPLTQLNDIRWCDNAAITVAEHGEEGFQLLVDGDNSHLSDISTIANQSWWK